MSVFDATTIFDAMFFARESIFDGFTAAEREQVIDILLSIESGDAGPWDCSRNVSKYFDLTFELIRLQCGDPALRVG